MFSAKETRTVLSKHNIHESFEVSLYQRGRHGKKIFGRVPSELLTPSKGTYLVQNDKKCVKYILTHR